MTIVDDIEFNDQKHYLGVLCRKGHSYRGQQLSLRLLRNGQCCGCKREYRLEKEPVRKPERVARRQEFANKPDKYVDPERFPFNPENHQLGNLCKERHNYGGTGKTIRKKTRNGLGGNCLACEREQYQVKAELRRIEQHKTQPYVKNCKCDSCQAELKRRAEARIPQKYETTKDWWKNNPGYAKEWYWRNPEKRREVYREYYARNRDKILTFLANYREENRDKINEIARNWRKTEKGRANTKAHKKLRNARRKKDGSIPYTREAWEQRKAYFDNCCAYCGTTGDMTLEHIIPLSDVRGFNSIDNVIPACWDCNCKRKRAQKMAYWYPQQPFFSVERFDKILSILGKHEFKSLFEDFELDLQTFVHSD